MKLDRITYRRLFNTGSFTNEAIELSGTLEPNEDILNAYAELHKVAQELHYSKNYEIYDQRGTHERIIQEEKLTPDEAIIRDINSCKDIKVLESYRLIVKNNPQFQETYNSKLKQLQDGLQ